MITAIKDSNSQPNPVYDYSIEYYINNQYRSFGSFSHVMEYCVRNNIPIEDVQPKIVVVTRNGIFDLANVEPYIES